MNKNNFDKYAELIFLIYVNLFFLFGIYCAVNVILQYFKK